MPACLIVTAKIAGRDAFMNGYSAAVVQVAPIGTPPTNGVAA